MNNIKEFLFIKRNGSLDAIDDEENQSFLEFIDSIPEGRMVSVLITKSIDKASLNQKKYLYALIDTIVDYSGYTKEEVKFYLKRKCGIDKSVAVMDKEEVSLLIDEANNIISLLTKKEEDYDN
jgi:hypothetical protein